MRAFRWCRLLLPLIDATAAADSDAIVVISLSCITSVTRGLPSVSVPVLSNIATEIYLTSPLRLHF